MPSNTSRPSNGGDGTKARGERRKQNTNNGGATTPPRTSSNTTSKARYNKSPGRPKRAAYKELLGAASVYALCVSAPALLGIAVRFYEDNVVSYLDGRSDWLAGGGGADGGAGGGAGAGAGGAAGAGGGEDQSYSDYARHYYDRAASYACDSAEYATGSVWCAHPEPPPMEDVALVDEARHWLISRIGDSVYIDVVLVTVLSLSLALVRVMLVSMLVPRYLAPRRLAAFTRCKSSHMLSSETSYEFSPARPLKAVRGSFVMDEEGRFLVAPDLEEEDLAGGGGGGSSGPPKLPWYDRVRKLVDRGLDVAYRILRKFRSSVRRSLGHEPASTYENLDATQTIRLLSAPRYATAIFRCLYCSASCAMAFFLFRSADFWPVYVGGKPTSSTRNCWDLSGSIAIGSLDSDFDHFNTALLLFFLAQASYQIHSLCFHVMSMALLLCYGGEGDERLVSMKSSMKSYLRPLAEHIISLTLIFGCYIFSGLRRLGAVCIFTLEISSISLQFLQVCINAPESSWLRNPKLIKRLHRFVVVPSFLYCRFFILPFIIWYSAAFESQDWLEQIEKAFMPGSAFVMYIFFNGMIAFIFGLNLIFFRRLLFHPHLQQFFRQAKAAR